MGDAGRHLSQRGEFGGMYHLLLIVLKQDGVLQQQTEAFRERLSISTKSNTRAAENMILLGKPGQRDQYAVAIPHTKNGSHKCVGIASRRQNGNRAALR